MKKILYVFLICNFAIAQNANYYSLFKDGKKYPKLVRYLQLGEGNEGSSKDGEITFYIDRQKFINRGKKHKIDTCNYSTIDKKKIVSVSQLIKDEYNEHLKRSKENNIKYPVSFSHDNSRIFILKILSAEKIIKYEVDWIYAEICSF